MPPLLDEIRSDGEDFSSFFVRGWFWASFKIYLIKYLKIIFKKFFCWIFEVHSRTCDNIFHDLWVILFHLTASTTSAYHDAIHKKEKILPQQLLAV